MTPDISRSMPLSHSGTDSSSAPAPCYLEFLRNHSLGSAPTASPSILTFEDIGIAYTSLENHTLYFRKLSATVYMSLHDQDADEDFRTPGFVGLYDQQDRSLWAAEITDAGVLRSLDELGNAATYFTDPKSQRMPVRMAVLSGPSTSITNKDMLKSFIVRKSPFLLYYQVLLLHEHVTTVTSSGTLAPSCKLYERVGLDEIPAPVLDSMNSLEWEDILLQ
jgi:hypothetical protein